MDKVASDMSSFFNRTVQKTEEAFKITEKTILDPEVEHLKAECEKRKKWADNLVSRLQSVIQQSIAARIDDMVQKGLDTKKEILNDAEKLGDEMIRIGTELGDDAYGTLLKRCGEAERAIGKAISDFRRRVEDGYLGALRSYSHNCAKSALKECEKLENLRLDLDRAKTLLKRFEDDASKKLHYEQLVSEAQSAFTRQVDITKKHLEQSIADFGKLRDSLIEFMKGERERYEQCLRAVKDALK